MKRSICLILSVILILSLAACASVSIEVPGTFYYRRTESSFQGSDGIIAPEERELMGSDGDLAAVLNLYCAGPVTSGLENPLPSGTRLRSYTLKDGVLTLDFDESLAALTGIDLTVAAGCLARTFLPMTGANTLTVSASGALLNEQTALHMTMEDLQIRDSSLDRLYQEMTVYYTDQNGRYLVGHELTLAPAAQEELPLQLLELLLTPPEGSGLRSALPEGTYFLSATVNDGLCTVNLNAEFERISSYAQNSTSHLLTVMAMVNTLTGLPQIQQVEFTVGGRLLVSYGPLSITAPLVHDERCVGPVRTGLGEQDMTLYLAHGEEGRLLGVPVRMGKSNSISQAELIMRYLLDFSEINGVGTHIPEGTRLNSIVITDGVCIVDLSGEYLEDPESLPISGRVIAASLCTLDEVWEVHIRVDGALPVEFEPSWFGPLRPNMYWYL